MTPLEKGIKFEFTATGKVFEIAKVTDKNISWYVGFNFKGGTGKNNLKMATTSRKMFEAAIKNGDYIIK